MSPAWSLQFCAQGYKIEDGEMQAMLPKPCTGAAACCPGGSLFASLSAPSILVPPYEELAKVRQTTEGWGVERAVSIISFHMGEKSNLYGLYVSSQEEECLAPVWLGTARQLVPDTSHLKHQSEARCCILSATMRCITLRWLKGSQMTASPF